MNKTYTTSDTEKSAPEFSRSSAGSLKIESKRTAEVFNEKVFQLKQKAIERGTKFADHQTTQLGEKLNSVKLATRDLKDRLKQEDQPGLAEGVSFIQEKLAEAADYLEEKNPQQMGNDFKDFSRKNPIALACALVAAGVATGRVIKAGSRYTSVNDRKFEPQPQEETSNNKVPS